MNVYHGDSLEILKLFASNSVDSAVTDPPYGLSFMGKHWDYDVPSVELWREVLRVLKPGGHLLSFGGDRTEHRMKVNIEDAGFEIRTTLAWNFGSGFPKSLNVTKALNALLPENVRCACVQRSTQTVQDSQSDYHPEYDSGDAQLHSEVSDAQDVSPLQADAASHIRADLHSDDLDTALARSLGRSSIDPLSTEDFSRLSQRLESDSLSSDSIQSDTLASKFSAELKAVHKTAQHIQDKNHSEYASASSSFTPGGVAGIYHKCPACQGFVAREGLGTALKPAAEFICMARKPLESKLTVAANVLKHGTGSLNIDASRIGNNPGYSYPTGPGGSNKNTYGEYAERGPVESTQGRWPANVLFDEEAAAMLDEQSGDRKGFSGGGTKGAGYRSEFVNGENKNKELPAQYFNDSGGASRFFYVAKASKRERNAGLEGMPEKDPPGSKRSTPAEGRSSALGAPRANHHPTVKPIKLMEYLVRMITPPGGVCLDPFMGSGTTGCAATRLGFGFIGIEREAEYLEIARKRIEASDGGT